MAVLLLVHAYKVIRFTMQMTMSGIILKPIQLDR
jgi:hypothetical protein